MKALHRHVAQLFVGVLGVLGTIASSAEDIDIFNGAAATTGSRPNVVIYLDNTANWNTAFDWEKTALQTVFNGLNADFNVGLMMFTETGGGAFNATTGNGNSGPDGAYVRYAVRQMTDANKTSLGTIVNGLHKINDKSNGGKLGIGMYEVYAYLAGVNAYAGHQKSKADAAAFTSNSKAGPTYLTPVTDGCQKNYVIYISNGPSSDNSSDSTTAKTMLAGIGGNTARIVPPDSATGGNEGNLGDEYARFLYQTADLQPTADQRQVAITYTIDVLPSTTGQGPYNTAILKSMAAQGGGRYFNANDAGALVQALNSIFSEIQAVNSVFASASLPVSVNTQGTYLNQVFMGMFRPDADGRPRWAGNLKQYQFVYDSTIDSLRIADRNGVPAISSATGFIAPSATSFWTQNSTFWSNAPSGTPPTVSDAPDGEVVEKGGAAFRLRTLHATSQAGRNVLTCAINACTSLINFDTTNIAGSTYQTAFGASSSTELTNLVNWARGTDNNGDENGPGSPTTVRPSIHGDVLHSRPAVVNYGGSTGVVVFYGTNDGMLHAVTGGQDNNDGRELWSFIAPEFFSIQKRLRANSPNIQLSTTPAGTGATPRNYGFDGPIGIYYNSSNGRAYLFAAMRRGGRFLYAFDISNPARPTLMWKKSSTDYATLGQTWSEPRPAHLRGHTNPVLIMGGGYDATAEDADPAVASTMGNSVIVLDAVNGTLVRNMPLGSHSVPSDVTLTDTNYDGYIDRAYVADLGGRLYRIDFETSEGDTGPVYWRSRNIATFGTGRKFFFAPDIVLTKSYVAIMLGSGDREKPLKTTSNDRFYMVKDTLTGMVNAAGSNYPALITETDLVPAGSSSVLLGLAKGWYYVLAANGEKVVNAPLTVGGVTYFATNRPTPPQPGSCSANLGEAKIYGLSFLDGGAGTDLNGDGVINSTDISRTLVGGGLPPSPVSGMVQIGNRTHLFVIGAAANNSGIEAEKQKLNIKSTRKRIYWNVKRDTGT